MINSKNESAALGKLLDIVLAYRLKSAGKITIPGWWGYTTSGRGGAGPMARYDRDMKLIPDCEWRDFPQDSECLNLFFEFLASEPDLFFSRKVLDDGFLANKLEMTIFPDRNVEMAWSFDAEMDRVLSEKAKKYMTPEEISEAELELAEYMQHKGRSRRIRRDVAKNQEETPAPAPAPEPQPWSIPELFQAIVSTTTGAAPDGWCKVVIDGEVWVEPDASGRALNNVSADFQAQMADGSVRQIHPQQPMAAMNALTLLQKQLHNDEGKPWRRLRIEFDSAAPEKVDYEFDQAGLWRPER